MNEVESLKREIEILQKRVNLLERKDNRRSAYKYIKIIIKIILILIVAVGIWKGYDYVVNGIPNMMEEKIKELNPFKKN